MNAELMRAVLEEIADFKPKPGEGEGVREWNRAGRYAAVAASHALRVASYSPVYDDEAVTEALASYPDSARIVIRDHDGAEADAGLTVGKLTMMLSRCEAFEQLTHDSRPPAATSDSRANSCRRSTPGATCLTTSDAPWRNSTPR
jgi:hypothetical protein